MKWSSVYLGVEISGTNEKTGSFKYEELVVVG